MLGDYNGAIVRFRRNSVFIRTFLILSLLTVIVIVAFYTFANNLYSERLQENMLESNQNLLAQASNTIDLQLSQLLMITSHFMKNRDVIESTTAPNTRKHSQNRSVAEQIATVVRSNDAIQNFYYYIPFNETIYASKNGLVNYISFDDFDRQSLVRTYLADLNGGVPITYQDIAADIRIINGNIYIYQRFPVKKLFGVAILELDSTALLKAIAGEDAGQDLAIFIYDQNNKPVFGRYMQYPSITFPDDAEFTGVFTKQDKLYFSYRAGSTGWRYVYSVSASLQMRRNISPLSILPFLFFFLIISLFFSLYVTRSIYKPIGNLMAAISSTHIDSGSVNRIKNEFDYLQVVYSDVSKKAEALSNLLENITPAILETLFKNIIHDNRSEDEYVEHTLASVGNPIREKQPYAVLLGEFSQPGQVSPTEIEKRFYGISFNRAIHGSLPENTKYYCFAEQDGILVTILCLDPARSAVELRGDITKLCAEIGQKIQQFPFEVVLAYGSVCSSIKELRLSFFEAQQMLRTRRYYGENDVGAISAELSGENEAPAFEGSYYFSQRISYLIQLATEGNRENAEEFAMRMIEEIRQRGRPETLCDDFLEFSDAVVENMVMLHIDDEAIRSLRERFKEKFEKCGESDHKLVHQASLFCMQAIEIMEQNSVKNSFRHVQSAREYIMDNYHNSSLSLNMTSEHIGISPAYLSKLFNEHLNKGFNNYVNWVRVEKAKQILTSTEISVAAVGLKTGFNSAQSFIRVFKRYIGMTPGQFRERKSENAGPIEID